MSKKKFILALVSNLFCVVLWILNTITRYSKNDIDFLTILTGIAALAWICRTIYDVCKYFAELNGQKNDTKGE